MKGLNITVGTVFESLKRPKVVEQLEALGAVVDNEVGKDTDLFVEAGFGQTQRSKGQRKRDQANRRKAMTLGLPTWNEIALAARLRRAARAGDQSIDRTAAPTTYEHAQTLTLAQKKQVHTSSDFDGAFLLHLVDFVRAYLEIVPGNLKGSLANWNPGHNGEPAPFQTAEGVNEGNICHPFTVGALSSGNESGMYEVLVFHLDGQPFRRVVHLPGSNSTTFGFNGHGDCLYELSELLGQGDLETLAIGAMVQYAKPGDSLATLVEDEIVGPWEHGWSDFLEE